MIDCIAIGIPDFVLLNQIILARKKRFIDVKCRAFSPFNLQLFINRALLSVLSVFFWKPDAKIRLI